ncbi:sensor histidine kinase [Salinispora vitiensis]|uniref:sensor histidine kinase n=1 Tax=Salinispora vitiensis TaxID=999544 RepID=UPI0013A57404|nr:histidine kinase [Salinispora vitiensis]
MIGSMLVARPDPRTVRARWVTFAGIASAGAACVVLAMSGVRWEDDPVVIALGAVGLLVFAAGVAGVAYLAVTPGLPARTTRLLLAGFTVTSALSVPMSAPLGAPQWPTWAFVGATIGGTAPLLPRRFAWAAAVAAPVTAALAAAWTGSSPRGTLTITGVLGLSIAVWNLVHQWFWTFLVQAQQARDAASRVAAGEERLRLAREVHDSLGHSLSVIALKTELASRLVHTDPDRAGREAEDARALAAAALTEMRAVVHGYRRVDLREQVLAVAQVLTSSGVRCDVRQPADDLPPALAGALLPVLREAVTNVMRHSRAQTCSITVARAGPGARLTVINDGARDAGAATADPHSGGLDGLADRLRETGGVLHTEHRDGVFKLKATVGAA